MKIINLYLIVINLFSIQIGVNAQQITDVGNQWDIATYGITPSISSYSLKIGSDTLIDNIIYKEVQSRNDTTSNNWTTVNYIREDSLKRVYLGTGVNEKLQYDFSLLVGDTFEIEPTYEIESQCRLVVSEIDSIKINNGEQRKRLHLSPIDDAFEFSFWIEGIGSPHGLMIDHLRIHCATDYGHSLTCFINNDEVLYPKAFGECWITPVVELDTENYFKIFPNPINDKLIVSKLEGFHIKRISIFSSLGSEVKQIPVSDETVEVDTKTLENGIYFLIITSIDEKLYSKKIVK